MLDTPISRQIKTSCQYNTNLLNHVIEYIRATEDMKILIKELTDKRNY